MAEREPSAWAGIIHHVKHELEHGMDFNVTMRGALRAAVAERDQQIAELREEVERVSNDAKVATLLESTYQGQIAALTDPARATATQHTVVAMQDERDNLRTKLATLTAVIEGMRAALGETLTNLHQAHLSAPLREKVRAAMDLAPVTVRERVAAERRVIEAAQRVVDECEDWTSPGLILLSPSVGTIQALKTALAALAARAEQETR